jgi:GWxTD domain-containing protein
MSFRIVTLLLAIASLNADGQPLAGSNFRHWYDASQEGVFRMTAVNTGKNIEIHFQYDTSRFNVRWEKRESYSQRSGDALSDGTLDVDQQVLTVPLPEKPWLLVASALNKTSGEQQLYYQLIESNYPVDCLVKGKGGVQMRPFLYLNTPYTISGPMPVLKVFRYSTPFKVGAAPYQEKEIYADPVLEPDSTFSINNNSEVVFKSEGLYLIQSDTNAAKGTAFRVVDGGFPKLSRLTDLGEALVFICTRDEYERLQAAGTDKVKFDKVILDITRDKDRARNVIRKYFRRVELANIFFTSFKEGWKTDRGMIYTIYGPPDEVSRAGSSEIWSYKKSKARFQFERSASIYDPDNYVLQRENRFMESWYYTVDMWRKNQVATAEEN